jgi:exodeoxyribonuclease VIII
MDSLEAGREAYQRNLDTYKRCMDSGRWPAYSSAIETLTLPRWAIQQAA